MYGLRFDVFLSDTDEATIAVAGLMTWFGICLTYIRFYKGFKAQGFDRSTLPYASKLQPFAAWYGMCFSLFICFVSMMCTVYLISIHNGPLIISSAAGQYSSRVTGSQPHLSQATCPSSSSPSYILVRNSGQGLLLSQSTKWTSSLVLNR